MPLVPIGVFDDFTWALALATDGNIAILTFHGVPDLEHPWVHTEPELFEAYMAYLAENDYSVIALRDLTDYVNPHTPSGFKDTNPL